MVTGLHPILDEVGLVARHLRVNKVVAQFFCVHCNHVHRHMLGALGSARCGSNSAANSFQLAVHCGRGKHHTLGHLNDEHRQKGVRHKPVQLGGFPPKTRCQSSTGHTPLLHGGEQNPTHTRGDLADDLTSPHDWRLPQQSHCEGLKLLGKVPAAHRTARSHKEHIAAVATAFSRQSDTTTQDVLETFMCHTTASPRNGCVRSPWRRPAHSH